MKHFQDTETGKIYAFDDGYDPVTANNRNIPSTLTEAIKRIRPVKAPVVFCLREARCDFTRRSHTMPVSRQE